MSLTQPNATKTTPVKISPEHPVAYFCAEYGFDARIPIYAGGLGILAGDTLKQAGEENFPFVGLGLLYKGKFQHQHIDHEGWQTDEDWNFAPTEVGLEPVIVADQPLIVHVVLGGVVIWLQVWKKQFSEQAVLYLLDSDMPQNHPHEQLLTQILYTGSMDYQVKQQLVLSAGSVKVLEALEIDPAVYHINEGRPAFIHWELVLMHMQKHETDYKTAHEYIRQKTVYTNHTLVAAANQGYPYDTLAYYARHYAQEIGISMEELLADGIEQDPHAFMITRFALNTSRKANGVSQLHSRLSQEAWPDYSWVNVTNGVHMKTWQDKRILDHQYDVQKLWENHLQLKIDTMHYIRDITGFNYNPDSLVIGWARRLAGYKQLNALVEDVERLRAILKHRQRPAQLLVAGKAHPGDVMGKKLLQQLIKYMHRELAESSLFIPNYNIEIAQMLVKGSDLWVNTPEIGREACGTSGMKCIANGVLQCTVADGWAAEADWDGAGWVIDHEHVSESLYSLLESQIVPCFYDRDSSGIPQAWVKKMQASIALANTFGADKMLESYKTQLYT